MHRIVKGLGTALAGAFLSPGAAAAQERLAPGVVLVYEATGGAQQRWRVESIETGLSLGGRDGCTRVRYAPGGPRADADVRLTCLVGDTLLAWSAAQQAWSVSRPLGARDSLDIAGTRGITRYLTGAVASDTIGGEVVTVVETVVLTIDTAGAVTRRLRERFAPSLGTATWGVFETPDGDDWRMTVEFRLIAIRPPE